MHSLRLVRLSPYAVTDLSSNLHKFVSITYENLGKVRVLNDLRKKDGVHSIIKKLEKKLQNI